MNLSISTLYYLLKNERIKAQEILLLAIMHVSAKNANNKWKCTWNDTLKMSFFKRQQKVALFHTRIVKIIQSFICIFSYTYWSLIDSMTPFYKGKSHSIKWLCPFAPLVNNCCVSREPRSSNVVDYDSKFGKNMLLVQNKRFFAATTFLIRKTRYKNVVKLQFKSHHWFVTEGLPSLILWIKKKWQASCVKMVQLSTCSITSVLIRGNINTLLFRWWFWIWNVKIVAAAAGQWPAKLCKCEISSRMYGIRIRFIRHLIVKCDESNWKWPTF